MGDVIFKRGIGSKTRGDISLTLPGDFVTFFDGGRFITRQVAAVRPKKQFICTEALEGESGVIDKASNVPWDEVYEIARLPADIVEKTKVEDPPEPELTEEPQPVEVPLEEPKPVQGIRVPGRAARPGDPDYK